MKGAHRLATKKRGGWIGNLRWIAVTFHFLGPAAGLSPYGPGRFIALETFVFAGVMTYLLYRRLSLNLSSFRITRVTGTLMVVFCWGCIWFTVYAIAMTDFA
jgi:hypothetical protein